jgi:hypothetical protein
MSARERRNWCLQEPGACKSISLTACVTAYCSSPPPPVYRNPFGMAVSLIHVVMHSKMEAVPVCAASVKLFSQHTN